MDVWELNDGDFVTITNRYEDLPAWLDLYPTEVKGRLVRKLVDTFNQGKYPDEPINECNLFRVKTGDKLILLRDSTQQIISINENSFVIGDNYKDETSVFFNFGAITNNVLDSQIINEAKEAKDFICELGMPREIDIEWRIG